ncbi:PEP-CTERM sorting domain-containing protein [Massilia sp. W12]|uniref:PEP-CTERM sorting domain-containing protein n=1 Tax=Massilia sp. W12 TaxID=3126507 RepID=UPI0030CDDB09
MLGASNIAGFPSQEMGRLTILQDGADTKWTLSANWADAYNASNPYVMGLEFSMLSGNLNQASLPLFDVAGQVGVKSFGRNGVVFTSANNSNRFTDGEQASWIFRNTNVEQFLIQNMHVNAIYNGQSVKFAPLSVPEPETWGIMLAGLALLGLRRYQRKQTLQA